MTKRSSAVRRLVMMLSAAGLLLLAGCESTRYLSQSVRGHLAVMQAARPVEAWLADPATPPVLRERLALSQRMRDFAVAELALPDNASYRRYADLGRPAVVWNVVAAPELSLTLHTWCFPVVGCVGYRGYFSRADAEALAARLRVAGEEVTVYGVPAYSTLGKLPGDFFADPLLSTFIRWPEGELARLIFHELAHQVAYAVDDTEFNESYATAVERLGGQRWLVSHASAEARDDDARLGARRHAFRALVQEARERLLTIYRSGKAADEQRRAKAEVFAQLRDAHARLKGGPWQGYEGYDAWFAGANNASIGVQAAYHALVPAFEALFEREGRDFVRFHAAVRRLAALPKAERRAALAATLEPTAAIASGAAL